jgi:hypothetical protein
MVHNGWRESVQHYFPPPMEDLSSFDPPAFRAGEFKELDPYDDSYVFFDSLEEDFPNRHLLEASPKVMSQMASLPWEEMKHKPLSIGTPCLISYSPKRSSKDVLPCGKLFAVLMELTYFGPGKRPKTGGVIHVCADQSAMPDFSYMTFSQIYEWGMDKDNCPYEYRFSDLTVTIKEMCHGENPPFPSESGHKNGYVFGLRYWRVCEYDLTIEKLLEPQIRIPSTLLRKFEQFPNESSVPDIFLPVPFINTNPVPEGAKPKRAHRVRKKRKILSEKTIEKTTESFMTDFCWDTVDLSSFLQPP